MRKRLSEIASYEVLLCVFVVLIHVLSECVEKIPKGTVLSSVIFCLSRSMTFVVPAFIISSGIKFANKFKKSKLNYFSFIGRRILKIYIPYLLIAVVYYLYFVYRLRWFSFSTAEMLEYIGIGTVVAPFYFIVIIMQFYILAPIWLSCYKNLTYAAGIFSALFIAVVSGFLLKDVPHGDRVFTTYLMYWVIGCYIGGDFDFNINKLRDKKIIIIPLGVIFSVLYIAMAFNEFSGKSYGYLIEISKMLFSIFASLSYLIIMPTHEVGISKKLAPLTYYVYLIHCLVIFETNHIMDDMGIKGLILRLVIRIVATYSISFLVAFLYRKIKKIR